MNAQPYRASALTVLFALLPAFNAAGATEPPVGESSLGTVLFETSCAPEQATAFDHAVALLHHMTYAQARAEFERVAAVDPTCAMAHWGVAMTLFQPLWPNRPQPGALRRGWQEVETARELQAPTRRERLFIESAAAFFAGPTSTDYWQRIRRWEEAMQKVHDAFPEDFEAAAFYALSLLASAPADTADSTHSERAADLLLTVYERSPNHPGAMHYLIHADDVTGREHKHLEVVRRYETIAPDNPHALHMPTHIYTRMGDWEGVVRGNLRAEEAALAFPAGEHGELVSDEFPHAIEYLVYAYLQQGADREALEQIQRLQETSNLESTFKTAFHAASIPARYTLERHAWAQAAQRKPREPAHIAWDRFPWPEAVTWFERGLGAARLGHLEMARGSLNRIAELEETAERAGETLFTSNVGILRLELAAWIAQSEGNASASVALLREAVELEASTPKHAVTPAPTLPALELLGDLLLEQGAAEEAFAAYRRPLELYSRRFNSLLGAARAARMMERTALARTYYGQLLEVAGGGSRRLEIEEARSF